MVAGDVYVATVTGPDFEMGLTDTELCTFISSLRRLNEAVANLAKAGQWGPQAGDRPESRGALRGLTWPQLVSLQEAEN